MKDIDTFLMAGWDFNDVWRICEGFDYPRLKAFGQYSGGSGTSADPFQIATPCDLMTLANEVNDYNKCFILTADIDLDPCLPGGQTFTAAVIAWDINNANTNFDGNAFSGVFDGAGYKITNLTTDTNGLGNDYLGLFGYVNGGGIKNIGLKDIRIIGDSNSNNIGGMAGYIYYSTISNCFSSGVVNGKSQLGGLVGYNGLNSTISNSYTTSDVNGLSIIGGVVGYNYGDISNCFFTGAANGSVYLGGLAGYCWSGGISNCYSTGNVTGNNYVGGLIGRSFYGSRIHYCYSTGLVSGISYLGGLIGSDTGNSTRYCYFLNTSGPSNGFGAPLTDAQMKQQSSFVGWDFATIWAICEGTNYPRLIWQIPAADFVCPDGVNFVDYSFFAERWLNTDCAANNDCDGTDFDLSGAMDIDDLKVFCGYWLEGL